MKSVVSPLNKQHRQLCHSTATELPPPSNQKINLISHALDRAYFDARARFFAQREPRIIDQAFQKIEQALQHRGDVVLLTLETGTGKTTRLPQLLRLMTYGNQHPGQARVAVLQPRRITTSEAAFFVAKECNVQLGKKEVGFSHGLEEACEDEHQVQIHYLTNGYFLARRSAPRAPHYDIVIIDEAHENSWEQRFIMAKLKAEIAHNHDTGRHHRLKLIITSATLDTPKYERYFTSAFGPPPSVLVPGRDRDVAWMELVEDPALVTERERRSGRRVMVVVPGKEDIERLHRQITGQLPADHNQGPEILPLHSQLTRREQEAAVRHAKIILSTKLGTTGLSPAVDTVIDLGERKVMIHDADGVRELHRVPASKAELKQAAGRVARRSDMPLEAKFYFDGHHSLEHLPEYPRPEYDLVIPEHQYLRERVAGRDPRRWQYCDQKPGEIPIRLLQAEKLFVRRGLISEQGHPTQLGILASRISAGPIAGKMIVEAARLERPGLELLEDITLAAAINEHEGVIDTGDSEKSSWRSCAGAENGYSIKSDLLAQVEALKTALKRGYSEFAMRRCGFIMANVHRAIESQRSWLGEALALRELFRSANRPLKPLDPSELHVTKRDALLRSIWAGMCDQIFVHIGCRTWSNGTGTSWRLPEVTIINRGKYLVGSPYRTERNDGDFSSRIQHATELDPAWFESHAHRCLSVAHKQRLDTLFRRQGWHIS